ncbi:unnamed protein product [Prunus armeniaca]|uniref:TF-B3 domain-containing protein n=1 Tax=Prunus armeniaca TaxID=36596 RepID=A0A6J5TWH9_PRUAR|nr:unnamed protein product [Prunus armeniaca]
MGMKGDFQFGYDSNSLNLLSEVSVVVKNWEEDDVEKAMAMAVRSCCCNPLHGYRFDGCLIPQKAMVKQNKRVFSSSSSSSSSLDMLAEVATQQLMELGDGNGLTTTWVFDEKVVLAEFIDFCAKKKRSEFKTFHFSDINIPKKKRSSIRRTQRRFLPHASHDSVPSISCMNMKRKRLSAHSGSDHGHEDNNNEALVQKKQKLVHVKSTADIKSPSSLKREMPQDMKNRISSIGGGDLKLVIEKELFDTDVADNNQRFSIPMKQVKEDFLSEKDQTELKLRDGHNQKHLVGIPVKVLDPSLKEYTLRLKKWTMGGSIVYNLVSGWREIAKANKLKTGDTLQLWSFRDDSNKLGFALVKVSTTTMEVDQSGLGAITSSQNGTNGHTLSTAKVNSLKTSDDTVHRWSIKCKSQFCFALVKVGKTKVEVQQCRHGASTCSSSQNGQTGSSISCISHDC